MPVKTYIYLLFATLLISGCKQNSQESNVQDIGLLRGDITLCGDGGFGDVDFAINCSIDVQETFNLAIALLHSFEYDEAEKAFAQVIDADPDCAMAYWGVAMSNFHALWLQSGTDYLTKGADILKASKSISKTEKEEDYINAISGFYKDWENKSHQERISLFEKNMKQLYFKYDNDKEAAIFYALALRAASDPSDKTYKNQIESGKILESLYPDQPNHPGIAHYIIHNYDYPELAHLALPTARRYAEIAPASAHAQHMPSHIFTRLGLWQESINSNLNSTSSALCYSQSIDEIGHWDEELHGMDYLVYAYLQIGDNKKAQEQQDYLNTFKKVFPANFKIAYSAASIPARIALENKDWKKASSLEFPPLEIDWNKFPWQKSIIHFARAMGFVRLGDIENTKSELATLKLNHEALVEISDVYKANQVLNQIHIIEAWIYFAKGEVQEGLALMEKAANFEYHTSKHPVTPGEVLPACELYGDMLLAANKAEEALIAYEFDLSQHPNRFNGLYGAASAAKLISDMNTVRKYSSILIQQCEGIDSGRKELVNARNDID